MIALLLIPLLLPFTLPALARRALPRLAPVTTLRALTACALACAGATRWIAPLLTVCAILPAATATTGVMAFHHEVEIAQGEEKR